jgi:hypothetical protein
MTHRGARGSAAGRRSGRTGAGRSRASGPRRRTAPCRATQHSRSARCGGFSAESALTALHSTRPSASRAGQLLAWAWGDRGPRRRRRAPALRWQSRRVTGGRLEEQRHSAAADGRDLRSQFCLAWTASSRRPGAERVRSPLPTGDGESAAERLRRAGPDSRRPQHRSWASGVTAALAAPRCDDRPKRPAAASSAEHLYEPASGEEQPAGAEQQPDAWFHARVGARRPDQGATGLSQRGSL